MARDGFSAWQRYGYTTRQIEGAEVLESQLQDGALYLGDNGRATCGALRCAGMTAYYTGRDLSGQPLLKITARQAVDHGIRCETCGFQPALVVLRTGGR